MYTNVVPVVPPLIASDPTCSVSPAKIMMVSMAGHQDTEIHDQTLANVAISDNRNRNHISVTLYESTINVMRIQLDCGEKSHKDSLHDRCSLTYYISVSIDLNDDGRFDDSENRVHHRTLTSEQRQRGLYDLEICIPAIDGINVKVGRHRMHLSLIPSEDYRKTCGNSAYSEKREYTVDIIPKATCEVTAISQPEIIRTLTCPPTPGNIKFVLIGGEQETYIRDGTPVNTVISAYKNRHPLAVTLFGDTIYLVRLQLNCPLPYRGDALETDCTLAHRVDVWIDLNDDGKFDESENQVHRRTPIDGESPEHGYDLQIIIPVIDGTYTKAGPHRMRLSLMQSEAHRRECGDTGYIETRQYIVNIIPRKTCPDLVRVTHCVPENLVCSTGSGAIFSVKLLGEQKTWIHDEMTRCSPRNNYENQDHLTVNLFTNKMYTLQIRLYCVEPWDHGNSYGQDPSLIGTNCNVDHYLDVWIDMNNDGKFDEITEHFVPNDDSNRGQIKRDYALSIAIPEINRESYVDEPHRMRVIVTRDQHNRKPCYNNGYGEARDYTVHISQNLPY